MHAFPTWPAEHALAPELQAVSTVHAFPTFAAGAEHWPVLHSEETTQEFPIRPWVQFFRLQSEGEVQMLPTLPTVHELYLQSSLLLHDAPALPPPTHTLGWPEQEVPSLAVQTPAGGVIEQTPSLFKAQRPSEGATAHVPLNATPRQSGSSLVQLVNISREQYCP